MYQNNYLKYIIEFFISFVFVTSLASCKGKRTNNSESKIDTPVITPILKPPSSFSDTLVITRPSAVFFNPDSMQLEKVKTLFSKDTYEDMLHQKKFLMRNAKIVLERFWARILIIETSSHRYLQFVKINKNKTCIDLNKIGDFWGIFLFDTKKEPELQDMMNIETGLGFYFSK